MTGGSVGGTLTLTGGGPIDESGPIHAAVLNISTTSGAITLAAAGNAIDRVTLATAGSDNATLYDASSLTIASANVGGALTLLSQHDL